MNTLKWPKSTKSNWFDKVIKNTFLCKSDHYKK